MKKKKELRAKGREASRVVWFRRAQEQFKKEQNPECTGTHTQYAILPVRVTRGPELISAHVERVTLLNLLNKYETI